MVDIWLKNQPLGVDLQACFYVTFNICGVSVPACCLLKNHGFGRGHVQVCNDNDRDEDVTLSAIGVLGDLADVCGEHVKSLYLQPPHFYREFVIECLQTDNTVLQNTATFTQNSISRLVGKV